MMKPDKRVRAPGTKNPRQKSSNFQEIIDGPVWLHLDGPDGPVVLLGIGHSRTKSYEIPEDGRTDRVTETGWVHKWRIIMVEPIERPRPRIDLLLKARAQTPKMSGLIAAVNAPKEDDKA